MCKEHWGPRGEGGGDYYGICHMVVTIKGGEPLVKVGEGVRPLNVYCDKSCTAGISTPRGGWGHVPPPPPPPPPEKFDSMRVFVRHSGSNFWADLVAVFT